MIDFVYRYDDFCSSTFRKVIFKFNGKHFPFANETFSQGFYLVKGYLMVHGPGSNATLGRSVFGINRHQRQWYWSRCRMGDRYLHVKPIAVIRPTVTHGSGTCNLTVRAQKRLLVFENRALHRTLGPKRDPTTGRLRMRSYEENAHWAAADHLHDQGS